MCHQTTCWGASVFFILKLSTMKKPHRYGGALFGGLKMLVYCLFCETVKCNYVADKAEHEFCCTAISPKQIQHTWSKGKMVDIEHDLLPGYVFLYSENEPLDIGRIQAIKGVIRCLCSSDKEYELTGEDEKFALMLLHNNGIIGETKVYQEGQIIRICEGAFKGLETRIVKVNRQKKRMQIEIPFANTFVKTWVGFDIINDPEG